jgi:hypothetical protein
MAEYWVGGTGEAYRGQEERRLDMVMALGLFDLTERDRRLLAWLSGWDQDTTDALADLFARLACPGRVAVEGGER